MRICCARRDAIFIDELRAHDLYDRTSQAFAVFLPVRSVAVMGDGRRYDYVDRVARRGDGRLHDRALGASAVRIPRARVAPHHQRGAGHLARDLRHLRASRRRPSSGNSDRDFMARRAGAGEVAQKKRARFR